MNNVYKMLGLDRLVSDPVILNRLNNAILENKKTMILGYKYQYYQWNPNDNLEFNLCKDKNNNFINSDIHCSGKNVIKLIFKNAFNTCDTTHIYYMNGLKTKEIFPVRIVCPDVLASPMLGDTIEGQMVAFAGEKITVCDSKPESKPSVNSNDDETVCLCGFICRVEKFIFGFDDINEEYWNLTVNTDIGRISFVTQKSNITNPVAGQFMTAEAILSFDVAIYLPVVDDSNNNCYEFNQYDNCKTVGFIPSQKKSERILVKNVKEGLFSEFQMACAESVVGNDEVISKSNISRWITEKLPAKIEKCNIMQILPSECDDFLGWNAIVVESSSFKSAIILKTDKNGFVNKINFLDASHYKFGFDDELHAIAILGYAFCEAKADFLKEYLLKDCKYFSDYAEKMSIGKNIIVHLNDIQHRLDNPREYSYKIVPSEEVLRKCNEYPRVYQEKWCALLYYENSLAAVVFVNINEFGEIFNILLSRDGEFLNNFQIFGNYHSISLGENINVKELLDKNYGIHNTLVSMRESLSNDESYKNTYVWKEADKFISRWLSKRGYTINDVVLEKDCIGYNCAKKGKDFAVYVFAFGKERYINLDGEYCKHLKDYPLSKNRKIIVLYLQVEAVADSDGNELFRVGYYKNTKFEPKEFALEEINGKNILVCYTEEEIFEKENRFLAAFNTQNLNVIKSVCPMGTNIVYYTHIFGSFGFYSYLSSLLKNYGKLKTAYVRYNEIEYRKLLYFDNFAFVVFKYSDQGKTTLLDLCPLDERYIEIIVDENKIDYENVVKYPDLTRVEFLPPEEKSRFAARLYFENGEKRKYIFNAYVMKNGDYVEADLSDEIVEIDKICFTDKIFKFGKKDMDIGIPLLRGYEKSDKGISFLNGYAISTAELYFNSIPI